MNKFLTLLCIHVLAFASSGCKEHESTPTGLNTTLLMFPVSKHATAPREPWFPEYAQYEKSLKLLDQHLSGRDARYKTILEEYNLPDPELLHQDLLALQDKKFTVFCYQAQRTVAKRNLDRFDSQSPYAKHQDYLYGLISHQYKIAYCDEYWGGEIDQQQAFACTLDDVTLSGLFSSSRLSVRAQQAMSLSAAGKLTADKRIQIIGIQQPYLHRLINHLATNRKAHRLEQSVYDEICFGIQNMMTLHHLQVVARDAGTRTGACALIITVGQFPHMANLLSTYRVHDTEGYIKNEHAYSSSFHENMSFWTTSDQNVR